MKQAGQIVLTLFPFTDLSGSKLRPVLMLRQASGRYDDWLVCMVSSQFHQAESGFDEWIKPTDADSASTGLKVQSILRLSRLAVLGGSLLVGSLGSVSHERLEAVRSRLAEWICSRGQ